MKLVVFCVASLVLSGCVGQGSWGKRQATGSFAQAARDAALEPQTWVPVLTAGVLVAANVDNKWSRDLADEQPLFGDDAAKVSDNLRDVASAAYITTALLAPSPTTRAKVRGLAVGAGTAIADGIVSRGLKEVTRRDRPDDSNNRSLPSGHASKASSRTAMAMRNLDHIDMPNWSRQLTTWSLHSVAVGAGLARVEARKHHLSDVLVGYALGNFMASFMYEYFLAGGTAGGQVSFQPVAGGGMLTLSVPVR